MKTITIDEQKLALQLFKWLSPTINEWSIDWLNFEKKKYIFLFIVYIEIYVYICIVII